jgi:WD40 repeat protein/serine/threonine protein kinase
MQLPHPIANLVRLARNAKGPKDRHDSAYFAWEASVRLAVAARPPSETDSLVMPSIGSFVAALRTEDHLCADRELLAVHAHFSEVGLDRSASPKAVDAKTLLRVLPAYRNKVIGHGSTRPGPFYEEAARAMLAGLEAAWREGFFWHRDATLVYVEEIVVDEKGRRARIYDMTGLGSTLEDARGGVVPESVRPGALYLRDDDQWTSLHPWLIRHENELRERVLFFNGRTKTSKYLDYVSGEELRGKPLAEAFPELEKDLTALFRSKPTETAEEKTDTSVYGGYRIVSKIGEGGMGVVHLARHETMDRQVALKLLPRELAADPTSVARFKREIAALGKCDHPNVVKVFASGQAHGTLWYAMELIDGADLSEIARSLSTTDDFQTALSTSVERVRKNRSSPDDEPASRRAEVHLGKPRARPYELAKLMRDAALGLQHLHDAGIVHRDIKPANLMVTSERRVVIMDLGLATLGDATRSITKDKSSILGTLRYMPPEQLQRNLLQVDRRVDLYSLGASFYELLTGRPFHDGDTEVRLVEQVLREDPPHPCKVEPKIPKDLGTIIRKATEKDARLRYDTAGALAADLEAFLEGRAIAARPPTLGYLLTLAVRRNVPLTIAIVAAVLMVSGGGLFTLIREARLRRESDRMRARAEQGEALAKKTTLGVLEEQGRQELLAGRPLRALLYLSEAYKSGANSRPLRFMLRDATSAVDSLIATMNGHEARVHCVKFSPDGSRIVTASRDRTVRVWSGEDGRALSTIQAHTLPVTCAQFSPDGANIVSYGSDGTVRVHRASDGLTLKTFVHDVKEPVNAALFSTDGRQIFSAGDDGTVKIWELSSDTPVRTLDVRKEIASENVGVASVASIALSEDGTRLVAAAQQVAVVWDVANYKVLAVLRGHREALRYVAFAPNDRNVIATAGFEERARIFKLSDDGKTSMLELLGHDQSLDEATFARDGKRLATTSLDGTARIFNVASGLLEASFKGHRGEVYTAVFSPNGELLLTSSQDETARLWEPWTGALIAVLEGHAGEVVDTAFHPSGTKIATASFDGTVKLWHARGGRRMWSSSTASAAAGAKSFALARSKSVEVRSFETPEVKGQVLPAPTTLAEIAALSPDGAFVAAADVEKEVYLWRVGQPTPTALGKRDHEVVELVFTTPDRLIVATRKTIEIWDVNDLKAPKVVAPSGEHGLLHVRASRSGTRILGHARGKIATLYDDRGSRVAAIPCGDGVVASAALDDQGTRAALACTTGKVILVDANNGATIKIIDAHVDSADGVRFSASGKRFVSVGRDKRANVWNATTAAFEIALEGHASFVRDAVFSSDESFVVTASADGTARIWDLARGKPIGVLDHGAADVHRVVLSADGRRLITEAVDRVRVWDLSEEARPADAVAALVAKNVPWTLVDGTAVPKR